MLFIVSLWHNLFLTKMESSFGLERPKLTFML